MGTEYRVGPGAPSGGGSVLVRIVSAMLDRAEHAGLARKELLTSIGLAESDLTIPDARLSLSAKSALWRVLQVRAGRDFGLLVGRFLGLSDLGLVGYTMKYSETLGSAIDRLARFSRILSADILVGLERQGDHSVVTYRRLVEAESPLGPEARIASTLSVMEELVGEPLRPCRVTLPHPAPRSLEVAESVFGLKPEYDCERASIVFDHPTMCRTIRGGTEDLATYLESYASQVMVTSVREIPFHERVRAALWTDISRKPHSISAVAKKLGLGPRTLQRHLKEEGTTYREIAADTRGELAIALLKTPDLSVESIAWQLGYDELASFYRWFRGWSGRTPGQVRSGQHQTRRRKP